MCFFLIFRTMYPKMSLLTLVNPKNIWVKIIFGHDTILLRIQGTADDFQSVCKLFKKKINSNGIKLVRTLSNNLKIHCIRSGCCLSWPKTTTDSRRRRISGWSICNIVPYIPTKWKKKSFAFCWRVLKEAKQTYSWYYKEAFAIKGDVKFYRQSLSL